MLYFLQVWRLTQQLHFTCFPPFFSNFFCALGQQKIKAFESRKMRWWPNLVSSQEELLQRKNFVKKQFIFDSLFRGQTLHKHYPQLNCKLRLKPGPKTTILYLVIRQPALVALKIKTKVSYLQTLQR